MPTAPRAYRVSVRPAPRDPKRYLWTIYGTRTLFREESCVAYDSIEQALSEAHTRMSELG